MKTFFFYLFYGFIWLITWLPWRIYFLISDIFFLLLFYVIRYRRKVVQTNLRNSFPDKSDNERKQIERKFYQHLCDYFFETVKQLHMSEEEMYEHCKFKNLEVLTEAYNDGKNVVAYLGHYGNWEWITFLTTQLNHKGVSIYHKLHNKHFDCFFYKLRTKFGARIVPMKETLRELVTLKKQGVLTFTGFIADQVPPNTKNRYWRPFLNQDTAVLIGPEKIAVKQKSVVVFLHMRKIKRGYYETEIIPMFDAPETTKEFEITDAFVELLSKQIEEAPEYWLWSHRRWKRKRPKDEKMIKQVAVE